MIDPCSARRLFGALVLRFDGVMSDVPNDSAAIVVAFLSRYMADRDSGTIESLASYQARYPGHEDAVADAYARVREPGDGAAHAETPDELEPRASSHAMRSFGAFELLAEIGRGGQGVVYLAHDTRMHRRVALKLLHASTSMSGEAMLRFRREVEAASRLNHPGICPLFEASSHDGIPYLAMAWIDGDSLAQIVRERKSADDEPTGSTSRIDQALVIGESVARALHAAHEAGVVHRDVKPGNIMLTPDGQALVLDFGLAYASESQSGTVTREGDVFGTPAYMSPEQIDPKHGRVDRRSDVYSLGASLFELLTLRRPFEAPTRDALYRAVLNDEVDDPRKHNRAISRDLAIVITTAMSKDRRYRYQNALEFAEDLRRVRELEPIAARPASPLLRTRRWVQRNPALTISLSCIFVLLGVALFQALRLVDAQRETLDERQALIDVRAMPFLVDEAEGLWPAIPEKVGDFDAWLREAEALLERVPLVRSALAKLDADNSAHDARRAHGAAYVAGLGAFDELVADVKRRRDSAFALATVMSESQEPWKRAARQIRESRIYRGLEIKPQLGLVPLGPDPRTGLQEFVHVQSGDIPRRDERGRLQLDESHGIVFVLLPSRAFWMGAQAKPGPNFDRDPYPCPIKLERVRVPAFFIAKFEMTQAQWKRTTGNNPSWWAFPMVLRHKDTGHARRRATGMHPVEQVTWTQADRTMRRLDLRLPSSAQWEYACRAGRGTRWPTGDDISSLRSFANLSDATVARTADSLQLPWPIDPGLDDGHIYHAPVGSFEPNAFGLYDMIGNVLEFCSDAFGGSQVSRVVRGGAFCTTALASRSAVATGLPIDHSSYITGVRPARALRK